jgi:hypothetical protein
MIKLRFLQNNIVFMKCLYLDEANTLRFYYREEDEVNAVQE